MDNEGIIIGTLKYHTICNHVAGLAHLTGRYCSVSDRYKPSNDFFLKNVVFNSFNVFGCLLHQLES